MLDGIDADAGLTTPEYAWNPIGLHESRHTYASLMIAALAQAGSFNAKLLQVLMGHSSIQVTYDKYGHLMPGDRESAASALDDYLKKQAQTVARAAGGVLPEETGAHAGAQTP